jgi:hypothetical protein
LRGGVLGRWPLTILQANYDLVTTRPPPPSTIMGPLVVGLISIVEPHWPLHGP